MRRFFKDLNIVFIYLFRHKKYQEWEDWEGVEMEDNNFRI